MLLAVDVGNTNTKLGLYRLDGQQPDLGAHWRLTTLRNQTVDEYCSRFMNLFAMHRMAACQVRHVIISSVVPQVESTLRQACRTCFHIEPLFVEPGIKTGMPVLVDHPAALGADRLADSIAAYERYGGPCIVVDFGTATKFEVVSEHGEYLGGAIAPGLGISADALFSHAARLTRVDIKRPAKIIGKNTNANLQSGLYFGYIGLVDGILERMIVELGQQPWVIATGGLAHLIAEDLRHNAEIDDMLTLDGLRILFERNRSDYTEDHGSVIKPAHYWGQPAVVS
jgi:type III pantothenate kinase